jgi:hypothetical protein
MIPRPLNLEQLVRCLERQFGPVELVPGEGYTKLRVAGTALTFLEAEKLCLGESTLDQLGHNRVLKDWLRSQRRRRKRLLYYEGDYAAGSEAR